MRSLFLTVVMLLISIDLHATPLKTITLAYSDVESFPFQMGNGNTLASPPGLSIDVIEQAAHLLDLEIKYVRLPGKRVLSQIKANQVDGGFIFSYSPERAKYASYPMIQRQVDSSLRIATLDYSFYKLRDQALDWDGTKLNDLDGVPVGAHGGFSVTKKLKANEIMTLEIESTDKLFEMLNKKRLAAIAIQSNIANSYIAEHHLSNIEKVTPPISTKDYYLIFSLNFSNKNPELVRKIWKVISEIRDDVIAKQIKEYISEEK